MHPHNAVRKAIDEIGKARVDDGGAGDDDVIVVRLKQVDWLRVDGGANAALHSIARNGVPDASGDRDADAGRDVLKLSRPGLGVCSRGPSAQAFKGEIRR
ncbi:MAG: hypothetical protein AAFQ42_12940 [Pseudomonadota bacterium]